ncbi:MAG: DUF1015 domain-containing protein [Desulfovibrionales bacterium]|nr:DUF1015 domain-containing protein [Desulfovibrionales bacterium]
MPQFIPLQFYKFNGSKPEIVPEKVISPPYDVLSSEDKDQLSRQIFNIVHIDSPKSYEDASSKLDSWISEKILIRDSQPEFYIMATEYKAGDEKRIRWGIFGGLKVHPFEDKKVFPHEQTYPKAKDDRLKLMQATKGQLSPIFGIYDDPDLIMEGIGQECSGQSPIIEFTQEPGVVNRVWNIPEKFNDAIQNILEHKKTYLSNISSPGLEIFPYHRIVSWKKKFNWEEVLSEAQKDFHITQSSGFSTQASLDHPNSFALVYDQGSALFVPKKQPDNTFEHIGAYILDKLMLRKAMILNDRDLASGEFLSYTHDQNKVLEEVKSKKSQAGFILKSVPMNILQDVCEMGEVMPRKSTYFYPKLPTGVLLHLWGYK